MCVYHERLRVPISWWLLMLVAAIILATEVIAGWGWAVALVSYGVIIGAPAAMLVSWGRARVEVHSGELRAGKHRLALTAAGKVAALDEAQARAMRGPRADPTAFMLVRPYLRTAVYIEVPGRDGGTPYWLVGTRHPAELAAAIDSARPATRAGGSRVG
jgi:hypothetical protein